MKLKPKNEKLYERLKQQLKKEIKIKKQAWPSLYASSQLVQRYKKAGGEYVGTSNSSYGIGRWFKEKWVDICHYPEKKPCGRNSHTKHYFKKYPKCRPLKRVTKETPMTVKEIIDKHSVKYLKRLCNDKRKYGLPKDGKAVRRKLNL